ncbi:hypothetical protein DZB84_05385 [Bacillus sp. HNG]|uniref:hypothetical protein n=1 Tax=Bacillus sp. HNG TaxID=2293325 RepID=UPI000E2F2E61|nr:hypothetical protein [Bacillus sp. HNG]RFB18344.1 hypothetical protein DZB84_05385 [Bacillus sp. HNG]
MKNPNEHTNHDIPMNTPLNPVFGMSNSLDTNNPFLSESVYAGNSIDEHTTLEQANAYLAEKELGQINENS